MDPSKEERPIRTKDKSLAIARSAEDKQGRNLVLLDVRRVCSYTDYLMICSGTSDRQVRAIADGIIETLQKKKLRPLSVEGYEKGHWVLIDCGDVVAHIFYEMTRYAYDLEGLWIDAERVDLAGRKTARTARRSARSARL